MAAPRAAVVKPTPAEFFNLVKSRFVKIYVGDREEPYEVPQDLLGWYSPYFKACFNGSFREGVEGVLRLPEDEPEFFDVLVEYVRSGSAKLDTKYNTLEEVLEFITFCDKYDILEAASAVADSVRRWMRICASDDWDKTEEFVKLAFSKLHEDNSTLKVVAEKMVALLMSFDADFVETVMFEMGDRATAIIMRTLLRETFFENGARRCGGDADD